MIRSDGLSIDELEALKSICEPPLLNLTDLVNFGNLGVRTIRHGKPAARDKLELKRYTDQVKEDWQRLQAVGRHLLCEPSSPKYIK